MREAVNLIWLISFLKSTRPPTLLKGLSFPTSLTLTKALPVNHPGPGILCYGATGNNNRRRRPRTAAQVDLRLRFQNLEQQLQRTWLYPDFHSAPIRLTKICLTASHRSRFPKSNGGSRPLPEAMQGLHTILCEICLPRCTKPVHLTGVVVTALTVVGVLDFMRKLKQKHAMNPIKLRHRYWPLPTGHTAQACPAIPRVVER